MSQQNQSTMRTAQETFQFPMDQAVEVQRTFAELVLNSLTMGDWVQSRGIELTKQGFNNYIQTLEATSQQMSQASQPGMMSANDQPVQSQQIPQQGAQSLSQQSQQPQQMQQQPQRRQQIQQPQSQQIQTQEPQTQEPQTQQRENLQQPQQQPQQIQQEPQVQPPREESHQQEQIQSPRQ